MSTEVNQNTSVVESAPAVETASVITPVAEQIAVSNLTAPIAEQPTSPVTQEYTPSIFGEEFPSIDALMGNIEAEPIEEQPTVEEQKEPVATQVEKPVEQQPVVKVEPTPQEQLFINKIATLENQLGQLYGYLQQQAQQQADQQQAAQQQTQAQPVSQPSAPKEKGFVKLAPEDLQSLAEENPAAAAVYLQQLQDYNFAQIQQQKYQEQQELYQARQKEQAQQNQAQFEQYVVSQLTKLGTEHPDFLDVQTGRVKPEVQPQFVDFLKTAGYDDEALSTLTNMRALVYYPDTGKYAPFGASAAQFLKVNYQLHNKIQQLEKEISDAKTKGEAEGAKRLLTKITEGKRPVSLGLVPSADATTPTANKHVSEDEYVKLPEKERMRLLMGNYAR